MKNLTDYIKVYKQAIPAELCDRILAEYKDCEQWTDARVGSGEVVDKDIRNVRDLNISHPELILQNQEIRKKIDEDVYKFAADVLAKYREIAPHGTIINDSGYTLLEYNTGCFYKQHTDNFLFAPRSISCSINLNDDYEGGEFAFFDDELSYSLRKGDVLMFPSNFMYPHAVKPVLSGTRYSIVTWFN
jgi:predicted 2-oxoglutarate/Fe(II)-dependent dioxygenase YbiX